MIHDSKTEKFVAVSSFFSAVGLAFTSLIISPDHDVAGGALMMCAQFLTLTATIFGIDYNYKKTINDKSKKYGTSKDPERN